MLRTDEYRTGNRLRTECEKYIVRCQFMKNYDVFISHANKDAGWCEQLAEHLRHRCLQAFLEKWQIKKINSDDLTAVMENGLAFCSRTVLVLTPAYLNEKKNWSEASRHFGNYKMLAGHKQFAISILLEDCPFPPFLRSFKHLDFRNPAAYQQTLEELIALIKNDSSENEISEPSILPEALTGNDVLKTRIVTIGGTFDTLHKGHKEYIRLAFQFADRVLIYVNSDKYVHEKKDYSVRPYETRVKKLKDFIEELRFENRCEIRCLQNHEELEYDYLEDKNIRNNIYMAVVPPEYYDCFLKLNYSREMHGMQPFLILIKLRKRNFKNVEFSSSMIRYHGIEE